MQTSNLLEDIDDLLAHLEDFTHGKDGDAITKMRYRIEQVLSIPTSEISDEQIERKISELHPFEFESHEVAFYEGCKWYREQLKKKQ